MKQFSALLMGIMCAFLFGCGGKEWTDRMSCSNAFHDSKLEIPMRIETVCGPDRKYFSDKTLEQMIGEIESYNKGGYDYLCEVFNEKKVLITQKSNVMGNMKISYYYMVCDEGAFYLNGLSPEYFLKDPDLSETSPNGAYVSTQTATVIPFHLIGGSTVYGAHWYRGNEFNGFYLGQEYECSADLKEIYDFYDSLERFSLQCAENSINVNNDLLITVAEGTIKFDIIERIAYE